MAFSHGKNTHLTIDNAAGTPTDISAYCDSASKPASVDTAETTTFGKGAKTYIPGLVDGTLSASGNFDPALDVIMTALLAAGGICSDGSLIDFVYGPEGSTSGKRRYTGKCILTSYEVSSPVGDKNTWSAEFQVSDTVTPGTF